MFTLPKKSAVKSALLYLVLFFAMVGIDIMTKDLVVARIPLGRTIPIIEDVIHFTYVRNTGAAFGIFANNTAALTVVSVVILLALLGGLFCAKPKDESVKLAFCMICSGAVGNLIDRISLGYVVDFIDFRLINFAVFNLADCFVCIGAFLLVIYILFHKDSPNSR